MSMIRRVAFVASCALLVSVSTASAQSCAGLPMERGATHVVGSVAFPMHRTEYGIGLTQQMTDEVAVGLGYTMSRYDSSASPDLPPGHAFSASGAYTFGRGRAEDDAELGLCPTLGVRYFALDHTSRLDVPVGVTIGGAFELGENDTLFTPFFAPRLVWIREVDTGTDARTFRRSLFTVGANLMFESAIANVVPGASRVFLGADLTRADHTRLEFGLRFGMMF